MQIQILRLSIVGALLVCSNANAQTIPSRAEAEAMPPRQLARLLLGDERAARVVEAKIGGIFGPHLDVVHLHEAPQSLPDGLCARQNYVVRLSSPRPLGAVSGNEGFQPTVETIRGGRWLGIAGESGCNGDNSFAAPLGMGEAELANLLKRLISVRSLAASGRPLPFSVECSEEPVGPAACTDGGRSALATLPLERTTNISPVYEPRCVITMSTVLATSCLSSLGQGKRTIVAWEVDLPHAAAHGTTWSVRLAPKDKVEAVGLKRQFVHYY